MSDNKKKSIEIIELTSITPSPKYNQLILKNSPSAKEKGDDFYLQELLEQKSRLYNERATEIELATADLMNKFNSQLNEVIVEINAHLALQYPEK